MATHAQVHHRPAESGRWLHSWVGQRGSGHLLMTPLGFVIELGGGLVEAVHCRRVPVVGLGEDRLVGRFLVAVVALIGRPSLVLAMADIGGPLTGEASASCPSGGRDRPRATPAHATGWPRSSTARSR
jgi:hypothetical protein